MIVKNIHINYKIHSETSLYFKVYTTHNEKQGDENYYQCSFKLEIFTTPCNKH
jgi:hypothetical protein